MAATATRPGKVPTKTVRVTNPAAAGGPAITATPPDYGNFVNYMGIGQIPSTLAKAGMTPWPSLPGGMTPTSLMAGLGKTNWNQQAMNALMPAYSTGVNAINYGLQNAMSQAAAKAAAMQGAYTAAGGAMPRVGSEYTALGNVLSGIGGATAPGTVTQTAAGLAPAGATPTDTSAAQSYVFGSAPGQALAQSGYYKDIGAAGEAQAMQMQGREQGMALQQQLQSGAITDYLGKMQDLTANMMGQVPQLGIALSGEARARAAGVLSGLQYETEQKMNIQNLLYQYAQLRATAGSNAAKFALDRWMGANLVNYHNNIATARLTSAQASLTRAQKAGTGGKGTGAYAGLTPDARASLVSKADDLAAGMFGGYGFTARGKRVPWSQLSPADQANQKATGAMDYTSALSRLKTLGLTQGDAESVLATYYNQPGVNAPIITQTTAQQLKQQYNVPIFNEIQKQANAYLKQGNVQGANALIQAALNGQLSLPGISGPMTQQQKANAASQAFGGLNFPSFLFGP